jgi:hypothetical protein
MQVMLAPIGTSPALTLVAADILGAEVADDAEDWTAVADAITGRLAQLRATQMDIAARAHISLTTLRELQHNIHPRHRRPQTLTALSEALGWPGDYPVLTALTAIERELGLLRDRVGRIEQQLAREDA